MSLPKDLINKESPLSNKDLDFLNEIKPDTSVQKEPDLNNDNQGTYSIETKYFVYIVVFFTAYSIVPSIMMTLKNIRNQYM